MPLEPECSDVCKRRSAQTSADFIDSTCNLNPIVLKGCEAKNCDKDSWDSVHSNDKSLATSKINDFLVL